MLLRLFTLVTFFSVLAFLFYSPNEEGLPSPASRLEAPSELSKSQQSKPLILSDSQSLRKTPIKMEFQEIQKDQQGASSDETGADEPADVENSKGSLRAPSSSLFPKYDIGKYSSPDALFFENDRGCPLLDCLPNKQALILGTRLQFNQTLTPSQFKGSWAFGDFNHQSPFLVFQ